jgi:hypothetical protein
VKPKRKLEAWERWRAKLRLLWAKNEVGHRADIEELLMRGPDLAGRGKAVALMPSHFHAHPDGSYTPCDCEEDKHE